MGRIEYTRLIEKQNNTLVVGHGVAQHQARGVEFYARMQQMIRLRGHYYKQKVNQ